MFRAMKLQPPHGWPSVWWELAIVTLGVLLALGAEQTIKGWDDGRELKAVREALRSEVRRNLTAVHFRAQMKPCVDRRLAEIRTVFGRRSSGRPLGIGAPAGRPVYWTESTGTWQIALTGQALSEMPLDETLAFSNAIDAYQAFTRLRDEEDAHWRALGLLDDPAILSDEDWPALRRTYGEAAALNARFTAVTEYILESATLGEPVRALRLPAAVSERLRQFCRPMLE
jgi:hypothetical protein